MSDATPQPPARTTVVHVTDGYDLYIGRANRTYGLSASRWANPYRIGRSQHAERSFSRDDVLAYYEQYVRNRPDLMAALPELVGKRLACWCHPKACHGDVLVKLLQEAGLEPE